MSALTNLELAVLDEIARQASTEALTAQIKSARVVSRTNTGAGFYTTLAIPDNAPATDIESPVGDVGAQVSGVRDGMGFLLWMEKGFARKLEGYSYEEAAEHTGLTVQSVKSHIQNGRRMLWQRLTKPADDVVRPSGRRRPVFWSL